MNINLKWKVLSDGMYVYAPTGKPKEYLNTLLFDRATRCNRKDPYRKDTGVRILMRLLGAKARIKSSDNA